MQRLSAPLFTFGGNRPLPTDDAHIRAQLPKGQYAMTGPGVVPESGNLPVRGDLSGTRSFFDSSKAERLLGWNHDT